MSPKKAYPRTPDGRYFVAKARMWRCTNPALDDTARRALVKALMRGRLAVKHAQDADQTAQARAQVDAAKRGLGERGPVWWGDGAPDEAGKHPKNTSYAQWWADLPEDQQALGVG